MDLIKNKYICIKCPHCNNIIVVFKKDINCQIFRHGIYKHNHKQIDPHLDKKQCDRLAAEGLIYGCGKPFKLVHKWNDFWQCNRWEPEICDYV